MSNTTLEEVFLRLCAQNTDINAGGVGDHGTLTFEDLKTLNADEAVELFNALAWSGGQIPSPSFETAGSRVTALVGDSAVTLGDIVLDAKTLHMKDKKAGSEAKPLVAQPLEDGTQTLRILLPARGLPGAKLCVAVPDIHLGAHSTPLISVRSVLLGY